MDMRMALIRGSLDPADLAGADLVIEAVTEDTATKLAVFSQLGAIDQARRDPCFQHVLPRYRPAGRGFRVEKT
jgi:hypothetical protein